jgi:hypothetical protein
VLLLLIGGAGWACVDLGVSPQTATVWDSQLTPTQAFPGISGQAAAVSQATGTSVGVDLQGGTAGAHHAWGLNLGTCAAPGMQIGEDADYPALDVSATGTASSQAQFGALLDLGHSYHVSVRVSASDTSRVACGNLVAR